MGIRPKILLAALIAPALYWTPAAVWPAEDAAPAPAAAEEAAALVLESRNTVMEEHRRAGAVYMIEVQKRNAGTYLLMDRDGQGQRESRSSDVENDVDTAKWSLFRW